MTCLLHSMIFSLFVTLSLALLLKSIALSKFIISLLRYTSYYRELCSSRCVTADIEFMHTFISVAIVKINKLLCIQHWLTLVRLIRFSSQYHLPCILVVLLCMVCIALWFLWICCGSDCLRSIQTAAMLSLMS